MTAAVTAGWKGFDWHDGQIASRNGGTIWTIGVWQPAITRPVLCERGYHMSSTPVAARGYVAGEIFGRVEAQGASHVDTDKSVHAEMRLVAAWRWTQRDSVAFAVFAAEQVLEIYERQYPDDKRPREAIEAAKRWLVTEGSATDAAYAAASAADAADAAGRAASAAGAAYAAYAAGAAGANLTAKLNAWIEARTAEMEPIEVPA